MHRCREDINNVSFLAIIIVNSGAMKHRTQFCILLFCENTISCFFVYVFYFEIILRLAVYPSMGIAKY